MKKFKSKFNLVFLIIALLHFIVSFFTDKLIFNFDSININNYIFCKIIFLLLVIIIWQLVAKLFINKDKNLKLYMKYFLIYFIPSMFILLLIWPGFWFGSDVYNFTALAVKAEYLYYLNYLTSVFYIVSYMLIPSPVGVVILLVILFSSVIAYIVKRTFDITKSKLSYLMYIPFFIFHTWFYIFFPNRPIIYGIFYLFLLVILIFDKIENKKLNLKKVMILSLLTALVATWRSESIYLVLAIPLFIFLTYKINLKSMIKVFFVIIVFTIIIKLPQDIYSNKSGELAKFERNLPIYISPLSYMLSQDIKVSAEDLTVIDKVLDVKLLKKYPSYTDTPAAWSEGGCIKSFTVDEYKEFQKVFMKVVINNPLVFLKTKAFTFAHSTAILSDGFSSAYVFSKENNNILGYKTTKSILGLNVRINTLLILEGKSLDANSSDQSNIFYRVISNLLIPLMTIGLLFINSIVKRRLYQFLFTGMLLAHTVILFLTAPASYFMYYFPIYLTGMFLLMIYLIKFIKNKKYNETFEIF